MEGMFGFQHLTGPPRDRDTSDHRHNRSGTPKEAVDPRVLESAAEATQAYSLVGELVDYLAVDNEGIIGVVDEIRPDGSIRIACGWLGRRDIVVHWNAVRRVQHGARELVLHDALPAVAEIRSASGFFARLMARLAGWSLGSPHAPL
jgi:hypothetical protein